jgi:acetyl esterase
MANPSYPVHPDYARIPSFTLRFNRVLVWLLNLFLAFDRFLQRKKADPRVERRSELLRSPDGSSFEVFVLRPRGCEERLPALLYYHGGAFALSYASTHLQACQRYAYEARCCVIFVDYRLGPSQPFPAGFDDCFESLRWAREKAAELRIDPDRIAVMGDSAGGAMAAGVAQKALDESIPLCAQLLVYPCLDSDCKSESAREFSHTPIWNAGCNRNMWQMYLKKVDREKPPAYAAPAHRDNLESLAQAYVETAEFDPLRDEGIEYAGRLEGQGVPVRLNTTKKTIHGYELAAENPETIRSMEERVDYLNRVFGA